MVIYRQKGKFILNRWLNLETAYVGDWRQLNLKHSAASILFITWFPLILFSFEIFMIGVIFLHTKKYSLNYTEIYAERLIKIKIYGVDIVYWFKLTKPLLCMYALKTMSLRYRLWKMQILSVPSHKNESRYARIMAYSGERCTFNHEIYEHRCST